MPRRGVLFTKAQAMQIDFLMAYARRELHVTSRGSGFKGYLQLRGPGERFSYAVSCQTCDKQESSLPGAKLAIAFLFEHLGHRTRVNNPVPRERTPAEVVDAARYNRHNVKRSDAPGADDVIHVLRLHPDGSLLFDIAHEAGVGQSRTLTILRTDPRVQRRDGKFYARS